MRSEHTTMVTQSLLAASHSHRPTRRACQASPNWVCRTNVVGMRARPNWITTREDKSQAVTSLTVGTAAAAGVPFSLDNAGQAASLHQSWGRQHWLAFWEMARPNNIVPSLLLVLVGACMAGGLQALQGATVWFTGVASAGIAVASCIINDYFDYSSGADIVNTPSKPLPLGSVPPDGAVLLASLIYIALLAAACLVPAAGVRLFVALASTATVVYTPVLKRLPAMKTLVVASTIAAAPWAGALAAGASAAQCRPVLLACCYVFLGVACRELLMDISDMPGDRAAGIRSVPVLLGSQPTLLIAGGLLVGGWALSVWAALRASRLAWVCSALGVPQLLGRWVAAIVATWNALEMAAPLAAVWREGYSPRSVAQAVEGTKVGVGAGTLLLAALR